VTTIVPEVPAAGDTDVVAGAGALALATPPLRMSEKFCDPFVSVPENVTTAVYAPAAGGAAT
jgi:hypothetical protein